MKETKDKTMRMWFGKHKEQIVLWSVIVLIAVPLIVYGLSEVSLLPVTGGNDWAGFWGGYIGAIIGGLMTLFVMKYTIESENAKSERQEKIQYFNDVIKISADFFECIGNLYVKIARCMIALSNEKYEQVLEENNRGARISTVLELMLETRKSEYDLSLYIDEASCLMNKVNVIMKNFVDLAEKSFSNDERNREFYLELDELMENIEHVKSTFEDVVKRNLYDL